MVGPYSHLKSRPGGLDLAARCDNMTRSLMIENRLCGIVAPDTMLSSLTTVPVFIELLS